MQVTPTVLVNNKNNNELYLHGHKRDLQHCKNILTITITITKFNQRRRYILWSRSQLLYCFSQYFSCSDMNSSNVVGHLNCFFLKVNLDQTKEAFIAVIQTCTLNVMFSLLTSTRNIIISGLGLGFMGLGLGFMSSGRNKNFILPLSPFCFAFLLRIFLWDWFVSHA